MYRIHSLGALLPLVEWVFIFLPILFHGLLGLAIIRSGVMNTVRMFTRATCGTCCSGRRESLRFCSSLLHVFHMHGWFHVDAWVRHVVEPWGRPVRPYSAPSTLGLALDGLVFPLLYAIGILTCVFHLSNGLWTMGITWGVWTSPAGQRRANICAVAWGCFWDSSGYRHCTARRRWMCQQAREVEDGLYSARS